MRESEREKERKRERGELNVQTVEFQVEIVCRIIRGNFIWKILSEKPFTV